MDFARFAYGELAITHAWEDFNFEPGLPFPESDDEAQADSDFNSLLQYWYPFNWVPDRESEPLVALAHFEELLGIWTRGQLWTKVPGRVFFYWHY